MDMILSALNVTQGHKVAIKQALNGSMPYTKKRSQLVCFKEEKITLNTVSKAESLYQLIFFIYLMLQVNVNQRNYKFYVYSVVCVPKLPKGS